MMINCVTCGRELPNHEPACSGTVDAINMSYSDALTLLRYASLKTDYLEVACDYCYSYPTHACVRVNTGLQCPTHQSRKETALRRRYAIVMADYVNDHFERKAADPP